MPVYSELAMSSCLRYLEGSSCRLYSGDDSGACAPCGQQTKLYLLVFCSQGLRRPRE